MSWCLSYAAVREGVVVETAKAPLNDSWVNRGVPARKHSREHQRRPEPQVRPQRQRRLRRVDQRAPQVDSNINGIGGARSTYGTNDAGVDDNPVGALGEDLHGSPVHAGVNLPVRQQHGHQAHQRQRRCRVAFVQPDAESRNVGIDLADEVNFDLCQFGQCLVFSTNRAGFVDDDMTTTASSWSSSSGTRAGARTWANRDHVWRRLSEQGKRFLWWTARRCLGAQTVGSTSNKSASDGQESADQDARRVRPGAGGSA